MEDEAHLFWLGEAWHSLAETCCFSSRSFSSSLLPALVPFLSSRRQAPHLAGDFVLECSRRASQQLLHVVVRLEGLPEAKKLLPQQSQLRCPQVLIVRHIHSSSLTSMAASNDPPSPGNRNSIAGNACDDEWKQAEGHDWPTPLISSIEEGKYLIV